MNNHRHVGRHPLRSYLTAGMEATRTGKACAVVMDAQYNVMFNWWQITNGWLNANETRDAASVHCGYVSFAFNHRKYIDAVMCVVIVMCVEGCGDVCGLMQWCVLSVTVMEWHNYVCGVMRWCVCAVMQDMCAVMRVECCSDVCGVMQWCVVWCRDVCGDAVMCVKWCSDVCGEMQWCVWSDAVMCVVMFVE